ncbi:hypothetical protein A1OW_04165 [Enterovibrio norvegicus]|uniref:acyltransferase family protein n=1 Tax=Enterovibrio norvegicus TaxID=188144 RepID=UPI0002FECBA4|nr:acyltransferase [Enterovibrio norvegicus]OEF59713.1 hypothetical protein A1OW_04165 [Enterovibrio norvegicus]
MKVLDFLGFNQEASVKASSKKRFLSLDAIRGFAAIQVAIFHSGMAKTITSPFAWLAVDLFFVLSGFVLAYRYFDGNKINVSTFISHRLARLYPLHIATFLLMYLYYNWVGMPVMTDGTSVSIVQNIFMLHSVGFNESGATWNMPSWSISVEFWINIIFVLFLYKTTSLIQFILSMFFYMLILRHSGTVGVSVDNYMGFLNNGMLRGMAGFLLGIVCYRIHQLSFKPSFLIGSVLEVLTISATLNLFSKLESHEILYGTFLSLPLFFGCIIVFSFDSGIVSLLTRKLKVNLLGDISYAIYLLHTPILIILPFVLGELNISMGQKLYFMVYFCLVILLSILTHYYFEKPSTKYLRDKFSLKENGAIILSMIALTSVLLAVHAV